MPTYKLQKPHTHAGKEYAKGDTVQVRADVAARYPEIFGQPVKDAAADAKKEG